MGRTVLLPMASACGPQITFSDEEWKDFESSSYRKTFSPPLREQIQKAWQAFVDEALFAEPLSAAETKVSNVKKALADTWRVVHQELINGGGDAAVFAKGIINKHLPASSKSANCAGSDAPQGSSDSFFKSMFAVETDRTSSNSIVATIQSCLRACENAEMDMKILKARRKTEGKKSPDRLAWEKLIGRVAQALRAHQFRVTRRKDVGSASPFVVLAQKMLTCVCEMEVCSHLRQRLKRQDGSYGLFADPAQQIGHVLRAMQSPKATPKPAPRIRRPKHVDSETGFRRSRPAC